MPEHSALVARVDELIFERHPDYIALLVTATGLTNGPSDGHSERQLADAAASLRARGLSRAVEHPHIAAWRQAFSAFGAKPSKFPSSAEALASRVLKGQPLPYVNRLVDLYNSVSLRHLLPIGGEDRDRLEGTLRLVVAEGDEPFDPRGDGADVERAAYGEIVWRDDRGVTCRRWNWRQGARTQLTGATRSAFFVLDRLQGLAEAELDLAAQEVVAGVRERAPGADVTVTRLAGDLQLPDLVRPIGAEVAGGARSNA